MSVIHLGDCVEVMAGMEAGSVDAIVTDPPYGIRFMGKAWDGAAIAKATAKRREYRPCDDPRAGKNGGYRSMASEAGRYDFRLSGNQAFQAWCEEWAAEALRVLKPSHYLLAFGGTRTWHRLACALEDAGFEIRDTLMWEYATGFPKGRACLKPAWEPIILARKPGPMRELGIEECRIGVRDESKMYIQPRPTTDAGGASWSKGEHVPFHYGDSGGRWPANLILDEEAGRLLDQQTGMLTTHPGKLSGGASSIYGSDASGAGYEYGVGDSGGASRFFFCAKASRAERNAGCEGMEERRGGGLAGTRDGSMLTGSGNERNPMAANHHPTVKPLALMRWLVKLVARPGELVLDPFTGSGTTGVACATEGREFIGIEREADYIAIAKARIDYAEAQQRLPV
jgi:site-specific DNA-methyltransferase (adenine-specific)